ncbi:MAG TPA: hypothetical protein PKE47_12015, partial [Verrucomicrobiota bacterium]|nr:hypothetical protein [Verrucomicrobiota bacterium]
DPGDPTMTPDEFVLGRSGRWLSLGHFFKMPESERRAEFIFGTAAEVMKMMEDLPSRPVMFRPGQGVAEPAAETDEMAAAIQASKGTAPAA